MKIDDIDAFVAVIRNASLSQAAESLGLTQSAITRRVQSLEESLGVALLDRNTKPLKPTASGLQVYEQCRRVLREVDGLRELVGTVLQDDVLFAGSLSDNISFFDPQPDMPWLLQCAQMAAIHDDIQAMPMGYNTLVGDMGTVLSGGQKQRVMLARALYKKPRILFLDEATSHLDVHCEQRVNAAIRALRITRIMVAHRPETIASADRVIVLGQGKVSLDESTARLAERQAAAAREQA